MVVAFPVPRTELPRVDVSPAEHAARKAQLTRMLASLLDEYERHTLQNLRKVDTRRWKASASRDRLKIYKERSSYAAKQPPPSSSNSSESASANAELDTDPSRVPLESTDSADSTNATAGPSEESAAATMRVSLLLGECAGRVENAMYAVNATTQSELAMANIFLHEDVADCAILHTMEGPTRDDPYHFVGYKWFVRKSPTTTHLVKHRDSVYVEAIGRTTTRTGDTLGYHIMHSVDLAAFPNMQARHCLRASQSIRTLYRQRPGNVVEVFLIGNVGPAGKLAGRLATVFVHDTLFNMPKLVECGEAKRLADMMRDLEPIRDERLHSKRFPGESCALCRFPKKRFGGSIDACHVCGLDVCTKCRIAKRSFQSDGILGRFQKLVCCKTCLLVVANAKAHGSDLTRGETVGAASTGGDDAPAPASTLSIVAQLGLGTSADTDTAASSVVSSSPSSSSLKLDSPVTARIPLPETALLSPSSDTRELTVLHPKGSGPTTTYRSHVIDISGSLAFLDIQNSRGLPSLLHGAALPPPTAAASASRSLYTTTYRGQVIDISGSLGLLDPAAVEMIEPVYDETSVRSPPFAVAAAVNNHNESPRGGASLAAAAASPPPPEPSPNTQAELYAKMLELQRKAEDAFETAQQNQQYLVGSHTSSS